MNHKSCRLKDIIDLTASAKIGLKGFSIINQGSIENILLVSPQERRIMLEEILGLKNIELKKEQYIGYNVVELSVLFQRSIEILDELKQIDHKFKNKA